MPALPAALRVPASWPGKSVQRGCLSGDVARPTCAFAVIAWTALPHGLRAAGNRAPWSEALTHIRGNLAFHALFIGTICLGLIVTQFGTTYPLHVLASQPVVDLWHWHFRDLQVYGLLLAWNGLLVVVAELPLTSWFLRFPPAQVIACGYLLQGFGFAMNIFSHNFSSLFLAMTVFTLGEMACAPVGSVYLAEVAPARMRGRYIGVLSLAFGISGIFGPLLGPRLLAWSPQFPLGSLRRARWHRRCRSWRGETLIVSTRRARSPACSSVLSGIRLALFKSAQAGEFFAKKTAHPRAAPALCI